MLKVESAMVSVAVRPSEVAETSDAFARWLRSRYARWNCHWLVAFASACVIQS